MDHKTLQDIFQEIYKEFSEMRPTSLDELEDGVLEAMQKLADYIQRNREGIWYQEAKEKGMPIGAGSADKTGDLLICRRNHIPGMCRYYENLSFRFTRKSVRGIL